MSVLKVSLFSILVLVLAVAGYFFYQNQKLSTELSFLKNTDLVKEVDALKLKLKSAEGAQDKLTSAEGKIKTLETALKQARPYVNVLKAFDDWQRPANAHLLDRDTSQIDSAISALGDEEVSDLWQEIKANFPRAKQTGDFRDNEVPVLVTSKLVRLLK